MLNAIKAINRSGMLTRTRHGKAIGKGSEPMDFGIIIAETWLKIIGLMIQFP
jgi:hypothetical protein